MFQQSTCLEGKLHLQPNKNFPQLLPRDNVSGSLEEEDEEEDQMLSEVLQPVHELEASLYLFRLNEKTYRKNPDGTRAEDEEQTQSRKIIIQTPHR